ncbi:MAG: GNAT family N-acetyltransferase [Burkholderiales bacterium]|nr:GNAT family N-acetyltransferase [Burkholderiales bacterium]
MEVTVTATDGVLEIQPLTPARWPALEAVFAGRGCSQARSCWCMYYRRSGPAAPRPAGSPAAAANRAALTALVDAGRFTGLLAYRAGEPVGWLSVGPREDYAKLRRSPVMKPVDAQAVWSVICFVVPGACRGQGVARALLAGAIDHARRHALTLEAYPVDRPGPAADEHLWFGTRSMFDAAGFTEVACRKPGRPVMRWAPG